MRNLRWRGLASLAVLMLFVSACGSESQSAASSDDQGSNAPSQAAEARPLVIAVAATPETIDSEFGVAPAAWDLEVTLYEHLVAYNYEPDADGVGIPQLDGEFQPRLAESWSYSDDGLTLTFKLREGVMSEYGNELTSEDVLWSWQRPFNVEGTGQWMFTSSGVKGEEGIRAVDKYTVALDLKAPSELFLHNQAILNSPSIMDSTEVKKHTTEDDPWATEWLSTHSASFGPYRLVTFTPGQEVVLETNPNYWDTPPLVSPITFREVPSSATRMQLLRDGTVQIAKDLNARERQELAGADGVRIINIKGNTNVIFGLNNDVPPLDNPLVRQAIAYAAPVDDIIETVYLDDPAARLLPGYTPENYPGHIDYFPYYPTDLDKARDLLEEANQGPFTMELVFNADVTDHEQVGILIQSQLAEIGIDVVLRNLPSAAYQEAFFGGTAQSVLVQDAIWNADPAYGLNLYFSQGEISHANWINYDNPDASALIEEATNALDPEEKVALAHEAYQLIVDGAPWAFAIGTGFQLAMRDDLAGFNWKTSNLLDLSDLYFK